MGVLGNTAHERFCQAVHRRVLAGEKRGSARTAAYREAIYKGENPDDQAIAPDARKLAGQKLVKARIQELGDYAAKLAGIDSSWALVVLKGYIDPGLMPERIDGEVVDVPVKVSDRIAAIGLMAKIAGLLAPTKVANEHNLGKGLEELIAQSYQKGAE